MKNVSGLKKYKKAAAFILALAMISALGLSGCSKDAAGSSDDAGRNESTADAGTEGDTDVAPASETDTEPEEIYLGVRDIEGNPSSCTDGSDASMCEAEFSATDPGADTGLLTDNNYDNACILETGETLTISGDGIRRIYIEWNRIAKDIAVSYDGKDVLLSGDMMLHQYIEFPEEVSTVSLRSDSDRMTIDGIYCYTDGKLPETVQIWEEPDREADILVFSTHADDEILFLGGVLAIYGAEKGYQVQVAYMTNYWDGQIIREHEKLDGLWKIGIRRYPISAEFSDIYAETLEGAREVYEEDKIEEWAVGLIRRFKPNVVVTQDENGEYGHGGHMLLADSVKDGASAAADSSRYPESADEYGAWDTPKTYLHIYGSEDSQISLPTSEPLSFFGGKTAVEAAADAYLMHVSQQWCWFYVSDTYEYSIAKFGLFRTTVGDDTANDMMEHVTPKDITSVSSGAAPAKKDEAPAPAESSDAVNRAANADGAVEIRTVSELIAASENRDGSYVLMTDLDLKGVDWKPWDFSGKFDGRGHSILNLHVTGMSDTTMKTYDGNRLEYDTHGAGFFGVLDNAEIKNLNLAAPRIEIETDEHAFAAPLAGLSEDSTFTGCSIKSGYVSLTDTAKMWGAGGIVGYGSGVIDTVDTEVTLVTVDKNTEEKDEQFMGGAYAAGFLDLLNVNVVIDGYDSDHGYVHNGGMVGMYIVYPTSIVDTFKGDVSNCSVWGKIKFFEDNPDRRAYCEPLMGEVMNWTFNYGPFTSDFTPDEVTDYSVDLYPEMCSSPSYTEKVTDPTAFELGFTEYTCESCGYTYKADYTVHKHEGSLTAIQEPEEGKPGISEGVCSLCGETFYEETQYAGATGNDASESGESGKAKDKDKEKTIDNKKDSGTDGKIRTVAVIIAAIAAALGGGLFVRWRMVVRERKRRAARKAARRKAAGRNAEGNKKRRRS